MNRTLFAIMLAGAGFTTVAIAQTAPAPMSPGDDAPAVQTRDDAMARADRRFDRMDANHDGKLSPDEMPARRMATSAPAPAADGTMPPPPAPDGAAAPAGPSRMFARLDTNGDGFVDRAEFRAQAARRFDRMDANHDGTVDAAEREAARDAMGAMGRHAGKAPPPPTAAQDPNAGQ